MDIQIYTKKIQRESTVEGEAPTNTFQDIVATMYTIG
jgi:hypothetical protein